MDSADGKSQLGEESVLETSENANPRPYTALSNTMAASHTATALDSTQAVFHGSGIQHTGKGHFKVHGNLNITSNPPSDPKEKAEKCMKALFVTDPSEDRAMLKRKKGKRANGTCEWILKTEKLNSWLHFEDTQQKSQSTSLLWLHGNPGTGKSTMAIYLTEELSTAFDAMKNMTLAYFFCDASFEKQKTATSIIRGLLYLLVQEHKSLLPKYILPTYKERGDQLFTSFDALWRVFLAAAADQDTGRKYCIIDALDECDNGSKEILLYQLHETFHCQEKPPPNLSILITSRPYPEIGEYLQDFTNADLASFYEARQDIERCIEERLHDLAKKKHYTDKVKGGITDLLRDKAEGTFLWVGLACEELRRRPSKDATRVLQDMPKGLASLYKSLLMTALEGETSERVTIQRILSFVTVSFNALSVLELSEACQLYQDEPDLDTRLQFTRDQIASCRLLVVIHAEKVQLLHQSVRDFLTGFDSGFFVTRPEAHASAALCCIDNLIKRFHDERKSTSSFHNYAAVYWTEHVGWAGERFVICEPQVPFFEHTSKYDMSGDTFLHVAAGYGLPILVEYALGIRGVHPIMGGPAFNIKQDPNLGHEIDSSPLTRVLMQYGADIKTQGEIVDMLLKAGAIVSPENADRAFRGTGADPKMVLSLLDHMHPETRTKYIPRLLQERRHFYNHLIPIILAKYGDSITVDEDMVINTLSSPNALRIVSLLDNQTRDQVSITGEMLEEAARNMYEGDKLVEILIKNQGDQILITENIIVAAMHNEQQGERILQKLCQHQKITITTEILEAAVVRKHGRKFLELLLQHREHQPTVTITHNMLHFGAMNHYGARKTISLIFEKLGSSIQRLDHMMTIAVKRLYDIEGFIEFLIQHGGTHIVITDEVVKAVLDVNSPGYEHRAACMELFFKHQQKLKFTGQALTAVREYKQNQVRGE